MNQNRHLVGFYIFKRRNLILKLIFLLCARVLSSHLVTRKIAIRYFLVFHKHMSTKPLSLLVPRQPAGTKPLRFTQSIKDAATQDMLNAYIECYSKVYGTSIDRNTIVEQMLLSLMSRDRDFMKYYSSLPKSPEAISARAALASATHDATAADSPDKAD